MKANLLILLACLTGCEENTKGVYYEEPEVLTQNVDNDLDGYWGDEDCDDADPGVNDGAPELCDGIDNNCNGEIDEEVTDRFYLDDDGDGFGDDLEWEDSCEPSEGFVQYGNDCDDDSDDIFPGAVEICDERDNNCNGEIDENLGGYYYADVDGDGYGNDEDSLQSCQVPTDHVLQGGDCNDGDDSIFPGAAEECDGIDNNCNGDVDETGSIPWYRDADIDGYGDATDTVSACLQPQGYVENAYDCDDGDFMINPDAVEICDNIDNDCNGISDDSASGGTTFYVDADLDGFGDPAQTIESCSLPFGYSANDDDCDDNRFESSPIALEYCNGIDDDCDGQSDEPDAVDASVFFSDADSDGYGDPYNPVPGCGIGPNMSTNNQDCNDLDRDVYPYATESCNGIDDNCNTLIDEQAIDQTIYYLDQDGDGTGGTQYQLACVAPAGHVTLTGDCDDNNAAVNPQTPESCNAIDDNCDGQIDEGIPADGWYLDSDMDGYGNANNIIYNCQQPQGYIGSAGDCDDSNPAINPQGVEICNGVDDDCNGVSDSGSPGADAFCFANSCLEILTADPGAQDGEYFIEFDSGILQTECDMGSFGGGWTQVFLDQMSPPDPGWTLQTTSSCGIWGQILGGYNVISGGSFDNEISTRGIPHTELWVEMDYITLDSWDDTNSAWGPDMAYVQFNGSNIWYTDIDNHLSIYGEVCGWYRPNYPEGSYDSRHYVSTIEAGSFSSFTLTAGSTLSQGPADESFGLDDVYVWVR